MKQLESLEATQNNPLEHTQNQPTLKIQNEQSEDFIRQNEEEHLLGREHGYGDSKILKDASKEYLTNKSVNSGIKMSVNSK